MNAMLKFVQALAAASMSSVEQEVAAGLPIEAAHVALAERIYTLFMRGEGDPPWAELAEGLAKTLVEKVAAQVWPVVKPAETAICEASVAMMAARQRFLTALLQAGTAPSTLAKVHARQAQDDAQFELDLAVKNLERLLALYKSRRGDARPETT